MHQALDFMERRQGLAWALCEVVFGIILGMALAQWTIPYILEWLRPMPAYMLGVAA